MTKSRKVLMGCGALIGASLLLGVTCALLLQTETTTGEITEGRVMSVAQEFIRQQVEFPEEAEFPWGSPKVLKLDESKWAVQGTVVAKNAFGVKSRLAFAFTVEHTAGTDPYVQGNWTPRGLDLQAP